MPISNKHAEAQLQVCSNYGTPENVAKPNNPDRVEHRAKAQSISRGTTNLVAQKE
jgi:hypothetical protein